MTTPDFAPNLFPGLGRRVVSDVLTEATFKFRLLIGRQIQSTRHGREFVPKFLEKPESVFNGQFLKALLDL